MSLRTNVVSGYVSQIYVLILGVALVPVYVQKMGAEAYGLVGFFAMLQAWFGMLDLGLSATTSREVSLYKSHQITAQNFAALYKGLGFVFGVLSGVGAVILFLAAPSIVKRWLVFYEIDQNDVLFCVRVMAACVGLKLMSGIYRGAITGAEYLTWLNAFSAVSATLKFVGVLLSMWLWGFTAIVFFLHQLVVAVLECLLLWHRTKSIVPHVGEGGLVDAVKAVAFRLKFMLSMAFVSVAWIMVSQLDKLVLSGILNLQDYAYFTLAMVVANGVTFLTGPIAGAVMPRMTRLHAEHANHELMLVYRKTTRVLMALVGPLSIAMAVYADQLLFAWTGDAVIAEHAAPVLRLYALGNGILAMSSFAYYLQYAKGQLRYHVYSCVLFLVLLMPAVIVAAVRYGAVGAGWVWLGFNLIYLLLWVAFVHHRLMPGLHNQWLLHDGVLVVLPSVLALWLSSYVLTWSEDRWGVFWQLSFLSLLVLMLTLLSVRDIRGMLLERFHVKDSM
jgi:O-antigen/teichoic acid export membrane protein